MDLQTHRFTEEDLKFRVDRVRISVPRLKTVAQISGLANPVVVNGGIRVHGVAISTGFYFGSYSEAAPYDANGPWFTQANSSFATWTQQSANTNVPASEATTFKRAGCWVTSWATVMHAQGMTKVEDQNSSSIVDLTPLTLARYSQKLGLFEDENNGIGLPTYSLPTLLKKLNAIPGNTKLGYKDQQGMDVGVIEDYLARKIPVVLKVAGHKHYVVANGMIPVKYEGNWIKTYLINDVGVTNNIAMVNTTNPSFDWKNQFEFALFMAPANMSIPSSLAIEIFSPAYAFVTDPLGRRRGLSPDDGILYDEIPGITEALGEPSHTLLPDSLSSPEPDADPKKYLHINQPVDGNYQVQVVGTGSGNYTLRTTKVNAFGFRTAELTYGSTSAGQVDPLTIAYTDASGDITPPVTVADYAGTTWNRLNPLVVHLAASDDASGVAQTLVSLNGNAPLMQNSITMDEEGVHELAYWSIDAAGNEEQHHALTVRNDFSAPTSSHNYTGTGSENGPVSLVFTAVDNLSGVTQSLLFLNGAAQSGFGTLNLMEPGHYEIEYYSIDVAGNIEERKSLEISIQIDGPPIRHLKAKAKGTEVSLKWTPNGSSEYAIFRSTQGPSSGFVEIARTEDRKYEDPGLSVGVTYYYKVTAGASQSEVVSATVAGGH